MFQSICFPWIIFITRNQEPTISLKTSIQCQRTSLTLNISGAVFRVFQFSFRKWSASWNYSVISSDTDLSSQFLDKKVVFSNEHIDLSMAASKESSQLAHKWSLFFQSSNKSIPDWSLFKTQTSQERLNVLVSFSVSEDSTDERSTDSALS